MQILSLLIISINRFFAPLRFAQNDRLLGFLGGFSWRLRRQLNPPPQFIANQCLSERSEESIVFDRVSIVSYPTYSPTTEAAPAVAVCFPGLIRSSQQLSNRLLHRFFQIGRAHV